MPTETEEDPRPDVATGTKEAGTGAPTTEYANFEYIDALHAHAPGLIEQYATGDKHVTMLKDDVRGEVWFVSKSDHHIVPKYTIMGSYGSGTLGPRNLAISEAVPFCLCQGDKSMVQIIPSVEEDSKSKPKCGTLYLLAKATGEEGGTEVHIPHHHCLWQINSGRSCRQACLHLRIPRRTPQAPRHGLLLGI
jgi:hypothetical protein